ncbi:MAG TPA: hypothetical protein VGG14_07665 [Candidatus Sulfotelmatobacter sp.]
MIALTVVGTSQAQTHPRPPGLQQAQQAETQAEAGIPPPTATRQKRIDAIEFQSEANDLARIAQTIPADVSSIQQGQLPKDFIEKLKEIEKLSKHLRSGIKPQ